jgi:hypothetical protein
VSGLDGERGRNRTFNLLIKSQLLCQLSYAPLCGWETTEKKDASGEDLHNINTMPLIPVGSRRPGNLVIQDPLFLSASAGIPAAEPGSNVRELQYLGTEGKASEPHSATLLNDIVYMQ